MRIAIASDHAGFELKGKLVPFLQNLGHEVEDFGAHELDPTDDYPDFVAPAAKAVSDGKADRGIVLGWSGQGEAMAANRIKGIRAAVVYHSGGQNVARLSREHNDSNVLSLGAKFLDEDVAKEIVGVWLETEFSGDERHVRRHKKMDTAS